MNDHGPYSRPARPWRGLTSLTLVVAALALAVALVWTLRDTLDPAARAEREAAQWRQQRIDAELSGLDVLTVAAWRVLPLLLVSGGAFVGLLALYNRIARYNVVQADKVIALQRAATQRFPDGLQSLSFHDSSRPQLAAPLGGDTPPPLPPGDLPTFGELLARGRIGRGNPLLLGFDVESGQELSGSWLDLYSTIVAGLPGSGKTTSQRFWACQVALFGAKFAICDPHAGAGDDSLAATLAPLSRAFLCVPASSDKAILEVVRLVADIGERRISGKDRDTTPIILWLDETTALLGRSSIADKLKELIERIAQEYRKRHVFCCASGQIWTAERASSELRDSFASVLCHRMKRGQARLLLPTDEAEQVERLETGRAVLWRTSGASSIVAIPNTSAQDVARVASLLADNRHTVMPRISQREAYHMPDDMPPGGLADAHPDLAITALGRATTASAEAMRAAALFMAGSDPTAIVYELRGVKTNEGKRYQTALAEVLGLIRQGVGGR